MRTKMKITEEKLKQIVKEHHFSDETDVMDMVETRFLPICRNTVIFMFFTGLFFGVLTCGVIVFVLMRVLGNIF